jgi:hypothetical protein
MKAIASCPYDHSCLSFDVIHGIHSIATAYRHKSAKALTPTCDDPRLGYPGSRAVRIASPDPQTN